MITILFLNLPLFFFFLRFTTVLLITNSPILLKNQKYNLLH